VTDAGFAVSDKVGIGGGVELAQLTGDDPD